MPIDPGLLNQAVVIEEATGQDEYGSRIIWTQIAATHADIQVMQSSSSTEATLATAEVRSTVTIRRRPNINANQRIRFRAHGEDHTLLILAVERPNVAQPELLHLTCKQFE